MKRKCISLLLVLAMLISTGIGVLPTPALAAGGEPSVALYLNGEWCSAQSVTGMTGQTWLTFPVPGRLMKSDDWNYVRLTTNVQNGTEPETWLSLNCTDVPGDNTFLTTNWWVDDNWSAITDKQANIYIEGFNGQNWERLHEDMEAYRDDTALPMGLQNDGSHRNYAWNLYVGKDLTGYTAFRVKVQMTVGSSLTVQMGENASLFAESFYLSCQLCDVCGGCKSADCTLGHRPTCTYRRIL